VNEVEGGSQDFYEQVSGQVMPDGQLPEGCQVHIAGPTEAGFRIITVWESEGQFEQFRNEKLIPAIRSFGDESLAAPNITTSPVHRLLTA
jgi:hypothetical protein